MKKLILAGATLAALLSPPALAADVAMKAPVYKAAPSPITAFTWTGCYIGGHAGGGWARKTWSDPTGAIFAPGTEFLSSNPSGFIGGGQVGCDYQMGSLVFGLEGQASWADLNQDSNFSVPTFIGPVGLVGRSKIDFLTTATARIGYAFDRTLIYAKGGAAWAHDEFSVFRTDGRLAASAKDTPLGWTVGAGAEYAFAPNWSAKIEYNFMDFGKNTNTFTCTAAAVGICTVAPMDIDQHVHTVKVGLNWRWSAGLPR